MSPIVQLIGLQEGCNVYDSAFAVGDLEALKALTVDEKQFLNFFYNKSPQLTMTSIVTHVKTVRFFFVRRSTPIFRLTLCSFCL